MTSEVPYTPQDKQIVVERVKDPFGGDDLDEVFLCHSNGLKLLCLAPEHAALQHGSIDGIKFAVGKDGKKDRIRQCEEISGKRKRKSVVLNEDAIVCKITAGGQEYKVRCGVKAYLIEPSDGGYIAVLNPFNDHRRKSRRRAERKS